jgi:hypothetical protein
MVRLDVGQNDREWGANVAANGDAFKAKTPTAPNPARNRELRLPSDMARKPVMHHIQLYLPALDSEG